MLTLVVVAVPVPALSLPLPRHSGAVVWVQGLSLHSSNGSSRGAASSSRAVAPTATTAEMTALSWCPVAVQS